MAGKVLSSGDQLVSDVHQSARNIPTLYTLFDLPRAARFTFLQKKGKAHPMLLYALREKRLIQLNPSLDTSEQGIPLSRQPKVCSVNRKICKQS